LRGFGSKNDVAPKLPQEVPHFFILQNQDLSLHLTSVFVLTAFF